MSDEPQVSIKGRSEPEEAIADRIWKLYKKAIIFPSLTVGVVKQIGILLYIACLVLSCGFVYVMFSDSGHTYSDYHMEAGGSGMSVIHRIPDIVACPVPRKRSDYQFNVVYNEYLISQMNMSVSDINLLTTKKFKACPNIGACGLLSNSSCDGRFRRYCEFLNTIIQSAKINNRFVNRNENGLYWFQRTILYQMLVDGSSSSKKLNWKNWNLEMLWVAILHNDTTWRGAKLADNKLTYPSRWPEITWRPECWIYGSADRDTSNRQCAYSARPLWVGKSFCSYVPGSALNESDTPFIGFNLAGIHPMKFWLGSLESMEINPDSFINNQKHKGFNNMPTASGVIYYTMTRIVDYTGGVLRCQDQPIVRGLNPSCVSDRSSKQERWFYDTSYQNRPIYRIWIYAKTKQTVVTKRTFTTFTQIQFAANIFSCCLGLSIMQIIQLGFGQVKKWKQVNLMVERVFHGTWIFVLLLATVILTAIDVREYFLLRYSNVFKEKDLPLPVPMIQICNDWYTKFGFINNTRFYDYNVSLDLYAYLRHVGFQRDDDVAIMVKKAHHISDDNGSITTVIEIPEYMVRNIKTGAEHMNNCSIPNRCHRLHDPLKGFMLIGYTDRVPLNLSHYLFRSLEIQREANDLSAKLGYRKEPTTAALTNNFYLDPNLLIKECKIGSHKINCGKFSHYILETGSHETCLVIKIPQHALPAKFMGSLKTGVDEALSISLDTTEYNEHSDIIGYYGPGTEKERKMFKNESMCREDMRVGPGWTKTGCNYDRSWKLKISKPDWYDSYIQLQLPGSGLTFSGSHIADIRMSFKETLPTIMGNKCFENSPEVCNYPAEEMTNIFKAVQLEIWCGCAFCFKESDKLVQALSTIMGKSVKCCSVSVLLECSTSNVRKAKIVDGLYETRNPSYTILSNMAYSIDANSENRRFAIPALWREASMNMIRSAIKDFDRLENETQDRLLQYTRQCFAEPCKRYTFDLFNYQNEKIDDGYVNITVFYGSKESLGTEQNDRWDPAQFIAILMCSYSFTFGIGIVGLCELVYLWIQKSRGKSDGCTEKILRDHVVRGVAALTDQEDSFKVHPKSDRPRRRRSWNLTEDDHKFFETRKQSSPNAIAIISSEKLEDLEKTESSITSYSSVLEAPDFSGSAMINKDPKRKEAKKSRSHSNGWIMVSVLLVSTFLMGSLLLYTIVSMDDKEYTADVLSSPPIEKPSVFLCAQNLDQATKLRDALKMSVCHVGWKAKKQKCSVFFKIFLKNREDRFCYIWDNSQSPKIKLDQAQSDLILEASPDMPELLVSVQGMSRTSLTRVSPYLKWKNKTMMLAYSTKLRHLEAGCETENPAQILASCQNGYRNAVSVHVCGFGESVKHPRILQNPCLWFQYGTSISLSEPTPLRILTVKPSQNNVLVFSVKSKHDFTRLLSIVGGFFGSFIEVTILSCFSIMVYIFFPAKYR